MDGKAENAKVAKLHRVTVANQLAHLYEERTIHGCNLLDSDSRVVGCILDQRFVVNRSGTVEGGEITLLFIDSTECLPILILTFGLSIVERI